MKKDIKAIAKLGIFSDVSVYISEVSSSEGSVDLVYVVKEKPYVKEIKFIGAENITAETLAEAISSKEHDVIDEEKVLQDRATIERQYKEKGYYLVNVSYKEVSLGKGESELHFIIEEGGKILIGDITFIGNNYFSSEELLAQFMSGTKTRLNSIMSSRANYSPEIIARDIAVLGYFYKNHGFAKVKVSSPTILIDNDKKFARITIKIEEGKQYKVDSVSFHGDVGKDFYTEDALHQSTELKSGELFRHSYLVKDIEKLGDLYGDKGYAYAYVNPVPTYDDDKGLVSLKYHIFKRNKVYIGSVKIVGNTVTRDNVIRRELESIHDGSLYSGTGVTNSRKNIMRLGFFEEVKVIKERSTTVDNLMDIKIEVKEKSTGKLTASFGATPAGDGGFSGIYGQGSYEQPNQFGRGWSLRGTGRYYNPTNFLFSVDFSNPRVADSLWYLGTSASWSTQMANYVIDYASLKNEIHANVTVGRKLFEHVSGFVNYGYQKKMLREDNLLVPDLIPLETVASYLGLRLSRNTLNNLLEPSEGSATNLKHKFVGGFLSGTEKYMETTFNFKYYHPIELIDEYQVVLKWNNVGARLWNTGVPFALLSRYRLGGLMT